ncbi:hypothetical protein Pint_32877 [Pistacia integerrima]|uniref:Uncharacterized protein n=1 Tax=Pistacia integerrima TaxID=434235 RepID=A0ACC0X9Q1_9ROSI|nr:hypothetical protein Pint_32877 [Pistacia integerrima]
MGRADKLVVTSVNEVELHSVDDSFVKWKKHSTAYSKYCSQRKRTPTPATIIKKATNTEKNTPEAQKVSLAAYHLEGEANQWWQWIRRTFEEEGRALSWENFEGELSARFGPSECEDCNEVLSRIKQSDISDGIRMFKPQTLKDAISLARMKDDQLSRQRRFIRPTPPIRASLTLPPANRAAPPTPANPI